MCGAVNTCTARFPESESTHDLHGFRRRSGATCRRCGYRTDGIGTSHLPNHPPGRVRAPLWRHRTEIENRPAHPGSLHREWTKAVLSSLTRITSSPHTSVGGFRMSGHATRAASNGSYLPCSAFSNHSWAWMALGRAKPSATHGLGEPDILENQKPRLCAALFSVIDIQRCYK